MQVVFSDDGWDDYLHWAEADTGVLRKINTLIQDARRLPFKGLGKPEPLKGGLAGWWSRRIAGDHRLVYRVIGKGPTKLIEIAACRYHY